MTHRQPSQRSRRLGFTLVELMVAMLAGTITVSAGYYLSTVSVRTIGDQMRASDTQMGLRVAMDQIRRDFSRAAYLGTRNSANLPAITCGGVATSSLAQPITAASVVINGSAGALAANILNPAVNLTRADLVTIEGSFASGMMFLVDSTPQPNNIVAIDPTTASFQVAFAPPASPGGGAAVYDATRFTDVFRPGRVLRFETAGLFYFRRITASNGGGAVPTVTLDAALPADLSCGSRGSSYVGVVSRIQYMVEPITVFPAPAAAADIINAITPFPAGVRPALGTHTRAALVRREIDYATNAPVVPSTASIVLDNLVEFQVNGIRNTAADGATPVYAVADSITAPTIQQVSTLNPEQLRSLVVTISSRSLEGDRVRSFMPRANLNAPMLTFQMDVDANQPAYYVSRVRTMRSEIFLPNTINQP